MSVAAEVAALRARREDGCDELHDGSPLVVLGVAHARAGYCRSPYHYAVTWTTDITV